MKHIIKVEVLENLPATRPLIAMDANKEFFVQQKAPVPPNDEIWYTSLYGEAITQYEASSLPEIVDNTYSNGKGVIKFKTDITSIGHRAFYKCISLASVTIPASVETIENEAFHGCTRLNSVTFGNSVAYIGTHAFNGCTSLTFIEIPSSVISIGGSAFLDCNNLTKVNIMDIAAWCNIDFEPSGHPLTYVEHLYVNNVEVSELVIPNGVTRIGNTAFYKCSALTSIEIPNSVTSIGSEAFRYCSGLTTAAIGNSVTSIGEHAFRSCTSLTSVMIPDSVTSIGNYAFAECTSLPVIDNIRYADTYLIEVVDTTQSSYTIQDGTKWLGHSAFYNCTSLTSIEIPDSVTRINEYAFGQISAKIIFSKLYSTYTNKIFDTAALNEVSFVFNVEFNISEIPADYSVSSILPKINDSGKGTITYNIYTDYAPCKDQVLTLVTQKTTVDVYHIDGTPWE